MSRRRRTRNRADILRGIGVDHVLIDDGKVATQARRIFPDGVDTALELVGTPTLPDTLRAAGCEVDVVSVYKTRSPPRPLLEALAELLGGGEIDVVTFTSSSTVDHLCDALGSRAAELLARTCVASIGPITTETAKKRGVRVDVSAAEYTIPGLVAALEKHFAK